MCFVMPRPRRHPTPIIVLNPWVRHCPHHVVSDRATRLWWWLAGRVASLRHWPWTSVWCVNTEVHALTQHVTSHQLTVITARLRSADMTTSSVRAASCLLLLTSSCLSSNVCILWRHDQTLNIHRDLHNIQRHVQPGVFSCRFQSDRRCQTLYQDVYIRSVVWITKNKHHIRMEREKTETPNTEHTTVDENNRWL